MIAAVYARKSNDDDRSTADGKSVERQVANAREFAERQGWHVNGDVFVDNDVSGTVPPELRPGMSKLLSALTPKPPFQRLVVMEQSRLGRDTAATLALIERIENAGVEVYSYQDSRAISLVDESGEMNATLR